MSPEFSPDPQAVVTLVVDDEAAIRNLLQLLLEAQSQPQFQVLTAASGHEALELSRRSAHRIDLLITDLNMGEMNGIELYQHLREERPDVAVLFVSGKTDGFRKSLPESPLLLKPFRAAEFLKTVGQVLAARKVK